MIRMSRLVGAPPAKGRREEAAPSVREAADRREKENGHAKAVTAPSVEAAPARAAGERPVQPKAAPRAAEEPRVSSHAEEAAAPPSVSKEDSQTLYQEILEFFGQVPSLIRDGRPLRWAAYEVITDRAIGHLELGPDLLWVAN